MQHKIRSPAGQSRHRTRDHQQVHPAQRDRPRGLDIDHLVEAWDSDTSRWTKERRVRYTKYPGGPATW